MSDAEWLTYKQLAERLGIGIPGARHKAKRRKWRLEHGNHPGDPVRVLVPAEFLTADRSPDRSEIDPPLTGADRLPDRASGRSPDEGKGTAPLATVLELVDAERDRADRRLADQQARHDAVLAQERAETARRLAEVQTLHLDTIGRMQAQAAVERSLWLERVDAAELRAERVEQRLDQVLDHLLHQQPAPATFWRDFWGKWFGPAKRGDLGD